MSNQDTKNKMLALYTETLQENKIIMGKLRSIEEDYTRLEQKCVDLLKENLLLKESVKNYKEMLRKLKS